MNFVTNILKKYIQTESELPAVLIEIPTEPENKENGTGVLHEISSEEYLSAHSSIISSGSKSENIRTRTSVLKEFDPLLQSSFSSPIIDTSFKETAEFTDKRIDQTLLVSIEGGDINDKKNVPEKSPEYYSACESSPVKSTESDRQLAYAKEILREAGEQIINFPEDLVPKVAPIQPPKAIITEIGDTGDTSIENVQTTPIITFPKDNRKPRFEYKGVPIEDPLEFIRRSIETNVSETVASPRYFKNRETFEALKRRSSLSPKPLFSDRLSPTSTSPKSGLLSSQSAPELSQPTDKVDVCPRVQLLRNTIDPADIPPLPKTSSLLVNISSGSEVYTGGELEGSKSECEFLGRDLRLREIVPSNTSITSEEAERLEKLQNQAALVPLPDEDDGIPSPQIFPPGQAYVFTFKDNRRTVEKISLDELDQETLTQLHLQRLVRQIEIEEKLVNPTIQQNLIDSYKIKIMDYSDELIRLQSELSELKLQLNASQQHKASLELEIRQKEEIIIKCQAESLKVEQAYKLEIKQLQEQLKENSKLIEKDSVKELEEQVKQARDAEAKAIADLNKWQKDQKDYASVFAGFEKLLYERAEEYSKISEEQEVLKKHLSNMEIAFSDVHSKYEKSKEVLISLKQNEDVLLTTLAKYEETHVLYDERYESLKAHAKGQIEKCNKEILALRQNHETEVAKLKAIIKRQDIKCSALEVTLQQKTAECEQLAALCDEVTGKKV